MDDYRELIERLRTHNDDDDRLYFKADVLMAEAANLIEQQQSWIASLEQNARDADRLYKELDGKLAVAQKRIKLYEQALKASWPEGAIGKAFDCWNAARKDGV